MNNKPKYTYPLLNQFYISYYNNNLPMNNAEIRILDTYDIDVIDWELKAYIVLCLYNNHQVDKAVLDLFRTSDEYPDLYNIFEIHKNEISKLSSYINTPKFLYYKIIGKQITEFSQLITNLSNNIIIIYKNIFKKRIEFATSNMDTISYYVYEIDIIGFKKIISKHEGLYGDGYSNLYSDFYELTNNSDVYTIRLRYN